MRRKSGNNAASAAPFAEFIPANAAAGAIPATNAAGGKIPSPEPAGEEVIARIAILQHGLVTRAQLLAAGFTPQRIHRRIVAKRLRPLHRGVYLVGPLMAPRAKEMAAVLACGRDAVVSHTSVAALWELGDNRDASGVHVLVPGRDCSSRPGIHAHRVCRLESDEVTILDGIPATTPARTIIDLACMLSARDVERALARAERSRLTNRAQVMSLLERYPYHRGSGQLRSLLQSGRDPILTRSEAEERLLALIRKADLPAPEANVMCSGYEVDFLWRSRRLVVEVDGVAYHSSPASFQSDRRRDAQLTAAGLRVIRVTWEQLVKRPEATLVSIAQAVAISPIAEK